jgi:DNA-binding NarL/FixJ family response regulator
VIAERLVVGERTVESHVSAILAKLQLANRAQVAAYVAQNSTWQLNGPQVAISVLGGSKDP